MGRLPGLPVGQSDKHTDVWVYRANITEYRGQITDDSWLKTIQTNTQTNVRSKM